VNIPWAIKMEEQKPLSQIFHRQVTGSDFKVLDHLKGEMEDGGPVYSVARCKNAVLVNVVGGVRTVSFSVSSSSIENLWLCLSRSDKLSHPPSCFNAETEESTLINGVQICTASTENAHGFTCCR
jgi:hypothetical protein